VTFTATVSASYSIYPAGTVEFLNGSTAISGCTSVAVNTGGTVSPATCTTSVLQPGSDSITADFAPTSSSLYATSTSSSTMVTVALGTTTALSANPTSVTPGAPVTFTATASASDGSTQSGTVEFFDGTTAITGCTAVAVNPPSPATCTTSTLPPGTDSVTASFTPTNNSYAMSQSSAVVVTVAAPPVKVKSITPSSLAPGVSEQVTIRGTGFVAGATLTGPAGVTFGNVKVVSSTKITATVKVSPRAKTGKDLPVTVVNGPAGVFNGVLAAGGRETGNVLTIVAAPTVKSVTPSSLAPGVSEQVTITGTGFVAGATLTGPAGVTFSGVKVVSPTKITATVKVVPNAKAGKDLPVTVVNDVAGGGGRGTGKVLTIN
jgi:hypothetical protein